jgi:putative endonuclease
MVQRPTRAEIGRLGERIAASFLGDRGYRVEMTNTTSGGGEIDIVASGPDGTVAFEVKTTTDGVDPTEAIDQRKLDALGRAMAALPVMVRRLDVIAVRITASGAEVRWLRDVS